MACIKDFKKDVNKMVEHLIQECYIHLAYSPPINQENVLDIISDAVVLRSEMIRGIHRASRSNSKPLKNTFDKMSDGFYNTVVELTDRLNSLSS